jgi:Flp pilus assembly protein TadD
MSKRRAFPVKSTILLSAAFLLGNVLLATAESLSRAEELYQKTEYDHSLALLQKNSDNPATNFLVGRNYFMQGDLKKATEFLQRASEEEPSNSEYADWLGRVFGKRAETSNVLVAPGYASKARQAFERAVALNPKNSDALSDLFSYYLDAPGFMGGGYDKAVAVADRVAVIDAPEAFHEKARLAQKRKEYKQAERHLRDAAAVAPNEVGPLITLAQFLAEQGRVQESDRVLVRAQQLDANAPRLWFARAEMLIRQQRDLPQAKALLEKYMRASLTPDDPPKQDALRLLKLTAQTGA